MDDERYAFHHALVRDVAYQQLAPRERRRTHLQVARWLERRASQTGRGSEPELLASIAQHRDLGGDRDGAHRGYRRAGELSLSLFAYGEASRLLRRASALADSPDAALTELLGDAVHNAESVNAGEQAYLEALELVGNDRTARARLCAKLGSCALRRLDTPAAVSWYERGLALVAPRGRLDADTAPEVAADLYARLAYAVGYTMGDGERGLRYGERAVELLEGEPAHRGALAQSLASLGAAYMRAGRWREQLACNRRHLAIAEQLGDLANQARAHTNLGIATWTTGDLDAALEHTRAGLGLAIKTGNTGHVALLRSNLSGILLERGDLDAADVELTESMRLAERTGHRNFLPESYSFRAHRRQPRRPRGRRPSRAPRHRSGQPRGVYHMGRRVLRVHGGVAALAGDGATAAAAFARAHECLRGADDYEEARTMAAEARALRRSGADPARALALRGAALEAFTRAAPRATWRWWTTTT